MGFYLRDQHISHLVLDGDALSHINSIFEDRFVRLKNELQSQSREAFFTYIIRFDDKGYRVFSLAELLAYFNQARRVERVIFTVESQEAIATGRRAGAYLELFLDSSEPNRCVLISSSDNKDWAESSFSSVREVFSKYRGKNWMIRNPWTGLLVQILGVVFGFFASLFFAIKISPALKFENSFVISFLFIILIFSNIWGYMNSLLMTFVWRLFPNIDFVRPEKARLHWVLQAVVGSSVFAVVVYLLGLGVAFLSDFMVRIL